MTQALDQAARQYVSDVFGDILCTTCAHYQGKGKCEAFPGGIPLEIVSGRVDHRKPYKDDGGITFNRQG